MKRVGLALDRQQCFGHGQIYVAFSRVSRMSGIKVLNTTGSAPNKILANVCKAILEPDDRDEENVLRKELLHPFVEPNPALKQTLIDDFITSSVRCHSPQNPPNSTGLDIYENDDDDNEIIDQDDITTDGGFVPRMPKGWNTRFDKNEDNYAQTTTDGFITTRDSSIKVCTSA